jgi:DNA-binding NarL/FixJ family response regulator
MKQIRILLIEDNRLLCDSVAAMLTKQADMRVVGVLEGSEDILLKARTLRAQVILADLRGIRMVTPLLKHISEFQVIGMGLNPTHVNIVDFLKAGASGFILKGATTEDFLTTIRSVARGAIVLPHQLASSLITRAIDLALKKEKGKSTSAVRMTEREREIISLIAEGHANKEIARQLNVSTFTVKSHVHNILEKTASHSRLQIVKYAFDEQLRPRRVVPSFRAQPYESPALSRGPHGLDTGAAPRAAVNAPYINAEPLLKRN